MRCQRLVLDQRMNQVPRLGIPDLAEHVIRNRGDAFTIGRRCDFANPAIVGGDCSRRLTLLKIPPDQSTIVAPCHELLTDDGRTRHIALVPLSSELDQFRLFMCHVDFADFEIGTTDKQIFNRKKSA